MHEYLGIFGIAGLTGKPVCSNTLQFSLPGPPPEHRSAEHTHQLIWVPQDHWLDRNSRDEGTCREKGHSNRLTARAAGPVPCWPQNKMGFSARLSWSAATQCLEGPSPSVLVENTENSRVTTLLAEGRQECLQAELHFDRTTGSTGGSEGLPHFFKEKKIIKKTTA